MQGIAFGLRGVAGSIVVAVTLLFAAATPAAAEPIEFRFTGVGSGSAGTRAFSNTPFTITALADTANVLLVPDVPGPIYSVVAPAVIDIQGVGGGRITTATRVFQNDTGTGTTPAVGFSRMPHNSGSDLLDLYNPALLGYRLRTSIGPVSDPVPQTWGQFVNVSSDLGLLTISSVTSGTFQATLVPEPAGLLVLSYAALGLRRRRR